MSDRTFAFSAHDLYDNCGRNEMLHCLRLCIKVRAMTGNMLKVCSAVPLEIKIFRSSEINK